MNNSRRKFVRAGIAGSLGFIVGNKTLWMNPALARSRDVPFRILTQGEVEAIDRLGELILPGAAEAGLSHFLDQQLSESAENCMLMVRYLGVETPYRDFYTQSLTALEASCQTRFRAGFSTLSDQDAEQMLDLIIKGSPEGWHGPPPPLFFFALRNDACDVVYGTEQGFANLGFPYMAHIAPLTPW